MVLSNGSVIYNSSPKTARDYFASCGFPVPPTTTNVADHILDISNPDFSSTAQIESLIANWKSHMNSQVLPHDSENLSLQWDALDENVHTTGRFQELLLLLERQAVIYSRDTTFYIVRMIMGVATCVFYGTVGPHSRSY